MLSNSYTQVYTSRIFRTLSLISAPLRLSRLDGSKAMGIPGPRPALWLLRALLFSQKEFAFVFCVLTVQQNSSGVPSTWTRL